MITLRKGSMSDECFSLNLDGQHVIYFLVFTDVDCVIVFNGNNNTYVLLGNSTNHIWRWITGKKESPPYVAMDHRRILGPGDKRIIREAARLYMNEVYSEPNEVRQNPWLTSLSSVVAQ